MTKRNFVIIGVGGYIAPRHLQAIKDTGNNLIAAFDISDSVGVLDQYFPECEFFINFQEFKYFINECLKNNTKIDYATICSPNHLHKEHIIWALSNNINVICEKPLVLNEEELDEIQKKESTTNAKVFSILQLRLHPSITNFKEKVKASLSNETLDIDLTYMTSRGKWYMKSWKGDEKKSGGITMNIGVHFFDMLHFIFGDAVKIEIHHRDEKTTCGIICFKRAIVRWFLTIDEKYLPDNAVSGEKKTFRSIKVKNDELEFSGGFTDLHTKSYENIFNDNGFGLEENRYAINSVEKLRSIPITNNPVEFHELLVKINR